MKTIIRLSVLVMAVSLFASSCTCFKKMVKNHDDVTITCTPEFLELNNGSVDAEINVTYPENYFDSKAVVKLTPVLVFEGGEIAGQPQYFQGSKVQENYTTISEDGGKATFNTSFPYDERMSISTLQLRAEVKCPSSCSPCSIGFQHANLNNGKLANKSQSAIFAGADQAAKEELGRKFGLDIAHGINTMQNDIDYSAAMAPMANDYKRVTTSVSKADLLYAINSSKVAKDAAKTNEIDTFKANVDSNLTNDRATQNLTVRGYASPDGPETLNDKLSKARSESGKASIEDLLAETGLDIDAAAYGEDWDGFKEKVQNSNIEDKDLILQVLSLSSSSSQRESQIKDMATVFNTLKTDVLPQLRRAQVVNSIDLQGKTDAEMMELVNAKNYNELTQEELLFVAENLTTSAEQKIDVLNYTAKKFNDARAYNNLGIAQSEAGQYSAAAASFAKAAKLDSSSEISNNLALVNLANGNAAEAQKYAATANADTKAAMAAAAGDYNTAAKSFEGYNAAIADFMNNDLNGAKNAISGDNSARADYLRAVIATTQGDNATAGAQLKSAVSKDSSLKAKAAKDALLVKLFESGFSL